MSCGPKRGLDTAALIWLTSVHAVTPWLQGQLMRRKCFLGAVYFKNVCTGQPAGQGCRAGQSARGGGPRAGSRCDVPSAPGRLAGPQCSSSAGPSACA